MTKRERAALDHYLRMKYYTYRMSLTGPEAELVGRQQQVLLSIAHRQIERAVRLAR